MCTWLSRLRRQCIRHKLRKAAHLEGRRQLLPWRICLINNNLPQPQVSNTSGEGFAYGDHKPGASEATLLLLRRRCLRLDAAEELPQEALCLAVPHGDAEHLAVAEGIVALGLPRSGCRSLQSRPGTPDAFSAAAAMGVGDIEEDVRTPPIWRRRWRRPAPPPGCQAARLKPVGEEAAQTQILLRRSLAAMGWPV
jgi:hypothetical protein